MKNYLHYLPLFAFILSPQFLFSQAQDIKYGPEEDAGRSNVVKVIHDETLGTFVLMSIKSDLILQKLNDRLAVEVSIELEDIEVGKLKHKIETVELWNGSLIALFYSRDKDAEKVNMSYVTIDPKKLTLSAPKNILTLPEPEKKGAATVRNFTFESGFGYEFVKNDENDMLVFTNESSSNSKKENASMAVIVLDQNFNKVWDNNFTFPFPDRSFDVENYVLDSKGNLFVYTTFTEKLEEKVDGSRYSQSIHIFQITEDGSVVKDYELDIDNSKVIDATMILRKGELVVVGFYYETSDRSKSGTFYVNIDAETRTVNNVHKKQFDWEFVTEHLSEKQEKRAEKQASKGLDATGVTDYLMRDIIEREDGGTILIAESYEFNISTSTVSNGNGGTTTVTTYHYSYDDIVIVSFDATGEIEWMRHEPKLQYSTNDGGYYSSVAIVINGDKIELVYNEDARNKFYKKGDKMYRYVPGAKDYFVNNITIQTDGTSTRKALFTGERGDLIAVPKQSVQISDHELLLFTKRKKVHQFVKVTY